ncbi:Hypothetical protein, putative [Bodo saltans]|uniref:MIF4G domain-containing protein n=1 Tax=Bodo saltans TaxID=75058 RepID=A0A0S4J374_BODSA|nr:Hypothetical protein, putative [Bodo saltans]|eukprot:CUG65243.1 Hypothetical protein, putative [Bodo saltans]
MSIPPRTSSAPLTAGGASAGESTAAPPTRMFAGSKLPFGKAANGGAPLPPHAGGFRGAPPAAGGATGGGSDFFNRSDAKDVSPTTRGFDGFRGGPAAAEAPAAVAAPAPVTTNSTGASPTNASVPDLPDEPLIEFPDDKVYDRRVMMRYRETKDDLPAPIKKFGMDLWSKMSDVSDRPDHMQISRDEMFSSGAHASSSHPTARLIRDRHLHHEVRGILARVTPEKYSVLKDELLALPIRQSDEADIKLVVETFFQKAIRPEDAPYAEFYVRLISDMIQHIGVKDATGTMIRKEIVTQCQAAFENTDSMLVDPESARAEGMDDEEFEMSRKLIKDKNKANINLLGLLFINGLVNERVVTNVLFILLYGPTERRTRRSRHTPADFEVEMFLELLLKIGKKISDHTKKFLDQFISTMTELSSNHPSKRIQFKLQDSLETIHNGFEPLKKRADKGPKKLADFEESLARQKDQQRENVDLQLAANRRHQNGPPQGLGGAQRIGGGGNSVASPTGGVAAPAPPPKTLPSVKEITDALESSPQKGIAEAAALLKELDRPTRREYLVKFMERPMQIIKHRDLRSHISEIFSNLIASNIVNAEDLRKVIQEHVRDFVLERGEHLEQPKYFSSWAELFQAQDQNDAVFTPDLHTSFLKLVVQDENSNIESISKFVAEVQKVCHAQEPRDVSAKRFRILPTLLLHRPNPEVIEEFDEELDEETRESNQDVLQQVSDPEVDFYTSLYNDESGPELLNTVSKAADRANITYSSKIICAIFCYVRFDCAFVCQQRKLTDVLKKFLGFTNSKGPVEIAWLGEVYATWRDLDRMPQNGLTTFVQWLVDSSIVSSASLSTFISELNKLGGEYEQDTQTLRSVIPSK